MHHLRLLTAVLLLAILALPLAAQETAAAPEGVGGSDFHKNDITYSTEVATPHVKWATNLPGGPIKGFFIPSVEFGRDMVELMQRVDLEPTTVSIDRNWDTNCWGIGDYYGHQFRGDIDDFRIVYNYVEKDITGPARFEVMMIPGLNGWSRMTRATRDAILKRVEDGAGLILLHPFVGDVKGHPFASDPIEMDGEESAAGDETPIKARETDVDTRIWDISPLINCPDDTVSERGYPQINTDALVTGKWQIEGSHFITDGLPVDLLPEGNVGGRFYKYEPNGEVLIKSGDYPILAVKRYGKGRVVALAYLEEGFLPEIKDRTEDKIYWDYWEYYYSLLSKCVVWAAGREGDLSMTSLAGAPDDITMTLCPSADTAVEFEVTARSAFGGPSTSSKGSAGLVAGPNTVRASADDFAPPGGWGGGKQIVDVIIRDPETSATLNWGSATFDVPKRASVYSVTPSSDVYCRGETLSVVTHSSGDLDGLMLRLTVSDDLDRVIFTQSKSTRGEKAFLMPLDDFIGKYAFITAELVDDAGRVIDQLRYKPILVVQKDRRPREYVANVSFGGGRHFFTAVRTAQIHSAGADTGFTWGGAVDNDLNIPRGAFGIYWYDRGPTNPEAMEKAIAEYEKTGDFEGLQYLTKKELFRRTGDKKFLTRVPCFSDPQYMKMLSDVTMGAARSKSQYNFDYYFVGDEGSLTSYSDAFDYCYGPHTLEAFRAWLKSEYSTLEALNAKWSTAFTDWKDVMPLTTDEARDSGNFAPWADHRTFMEITFANAYKTVRDSVTRGDKEGHIAVSGTQGTAAWNGCDWYRLDQVIDDFLAYGGGNQWDLHRSFAKPGSMIGFWTGYGSSGIAVQNAIWTAAIHNVLYPNIFWMFSYLDPDFTLSDSARDMGKAFKALKFEGVGKLFIESERLQDGIAVHWSIASVHAAAVTAPAEGQESNQIVRNLGSSRDGWVSCIKDLGLQFDFVAYEQIENGLLDSGKYRVFIMPSSVAVSPEEAAAIRRFVENGGTVITDAAAGVMDDHCAWAEDGMLNDLFGITASPSSKRTLLGELPRWRRRRGEEPQERKTGITGAVTVSADGAAMGLDPAELEGVEVCEAGINGDSAEPLLSVGDSAAGALYYNKVGTGRTFYANMLFDVYPSLRRAGFGGGNYRALLRAMLAQAGVKPSIEVLGADGKPLTQAVVARYKFADSEILAVVKENVRLQAVTGFDGVTQYQDEDLGTVATQDITIRLPGTAYVSDVRTGTKMGAADNVKTSILIGGALVLGLSPAESTIAVTGPEKAVLGEHPVFTVSCAPAAKSLVRCHFFAPDGAFLNDYAANILCTAGAGSVVLPSALNDKPGQYTLKVTDVVTGSSAEAKITLE